MKVQKEQTASEYTYKVGKQRKVVIKKTLEEGQESRRTEFSVYISDYSSDTFSIDDVQDIAVLAQAITEYKGVVSVLQEELKTLKAFMDAALEDETDEETTETTE